MLEFAPINNKLRLAMCKKKMCVYKHKFHKGEHTLKPTISVCIYFST